MKQFFYCEICGEETPHKLIREKTHLYMCEECGNYANFPPEKEIVVNAIISFEGESERGKVRLKESEEIEKGDEFIVETDSGFRIGEVTSIELLNDKRSETANAKQIKTIWLRDTGEVGVRISLHKRAITTPVTIYVPGETEFTVGEELEFGNKRYRITKIKVREGKVLDRKGDSIKAKNIRRVYAKFEGKIKGK
ncbi:MAG: hypothetical protein H0Z28_04020 [Archaeoglobus sp.]|nr:hypothetical protein [Archaeoglobus sp.]